MRRSVNPSLIRNFTFGVEDSLASSVGLLSGVASAGMSNSAAVVTGLVLIVVEALSMGVGSLLSDISTAEYEKHHSLSLNASVPGAITMFFSYLLSGFIPLAPYYFLPISNALPVSIILTLVCLAALGAVNALLSKTSPVPHAMRMLILGGSVAIAGVIIGKLLKPAI